MAITVDKFGKDHWSAFAYVESACVDGQDNVGSISKQRMRCNPGSHPLLSAGQEWKDSYSTRLAGFFQYEDKSDPVKAAEAGFLVLGHDDWDCLDDLEAEGLIEVISLVNGFVKMTEKGSKVAAHLREHKSGGGHFATFKMAA